MKRILISIMTICLMFSLTSCKNGGKDANSATDVDGNVYKTVKIGEQLWMAENLKVTKYTDKTPIPNIVISDYEGWQSDTKGAMCYYDDDVKNAEALGALYNWYAVKTKNLCPSGWHVPDTADWIVLKNHIINTEGDEEIAKYMVSSSPNDKGLWVTVEGSIPSGFPGDITDKKEPKRNSSGFSAVPAGSRERTAISCDGLGKSAYFWSATESDEDLAYFCSLGYNHYGFGCYSKQMASGYSVRCVKD